MAGSKLPHWQKVVKEKFIEIKNHPDFEDDFATLYSTKDYAEIFKLNLERFARKYDTPLGTISFLWHSILFDDTNLENVTPPIFIVSEVDKQVLPSNDPSIEMEAYGQHLSIDRRGRVLLDLTANMQREDLDDFLDRYFTKLIKPKLEMLDTNRFKSYQTKQPNAFNVIAGLYKKKC